MCAMRITGYADLFGVNPGKTIRFYVNCDGPKEYNVEIVKMINGDTNPRGPGHIEETANAKCDGKYPGRKQVPLIPTTTLRGLVTKKPIGLN